MAQQNKLRFDFKIKRGGYKRIKLTWTDANGAAIDLTGRYFKLQIKANKNSTAVLATLTSDDDILIPEPETGEIFLNFTTEVTADFDFDKGVYDLYSLLDSNKSYILEGEILVEGVVTT